MPNLVGNFEGWAICVGCMFMHADHQMLILLKLDLMSQYSKNFLCFHFLKKLTHFVVRLKWDKRVSCACYCSTNGFLDICCKVNMLIYAL